VTPGQPRDYVRAFQAVPQHFQVRYRTSAPLGVHILLYVTPDWIEETGDLHAKDNPRNQMLYQAAQEFVRDIPGLVAARMDLDEQGGGVVDIFLAPIFPRQSRLRKDGTRGSDIPEISVSKLGTLWQTHSGERVGFCGLQTLWAEYCGKVLDPRLERGRRKSETGREHLSVPEYKAAGERAAAMTAEAEAIMERAQQIAAEVRDERARMDEQTSEFSHQSNILHAQEARLAAEQDAVNRIVQQAQISQTRARRTEADARALQKGLAAQKASLSRERANVQHERARITEDYRHLKETRGQLAAEREAVRRLQEDAVRRQQELDNGFRQLAVDQSRLNAAHERRSRLIEADRKVLDDEQERLEIWERQFAERSEQITLGTKELKEQEREAERVRQQREAALAEERAHHATRVREDNDAIVRRRMALDEKQERLKARTDQLALGIERLRKETDDLEIARRTFDSNRRIQEDQRKEIAQASDSLRAREAAVLQNRGDLAEERQRLEDQRRLIERTASEIQAEKMGISLERQELALQLEANANFIASLENGIQKLFAWEIRSKNDLKNNADLSPAADPLLKMFNAMQKIGRTFNEAKEAEKLAGDRLKSADTLFAEAAADKVRAADLLNNLSDAVAKFEPLRNKLSQEQRQIFDRTQQLFTQHKVRKNPSQGERER
jgi:chromosome segregation ATPase